MGRDIRLGVIVRTDNTGLGYQSRAFAHMFNPAKVLEVSQGDDIPSFAQYEEFLRDIDVMITAETPYTYEAWNWARMAGIKTICQPNWEFFDGLVQPNMPHPDQYIIPSYWHLEDFQEKFPNSFYLPPPLNPADFIHAKETNLARKGKRRFVHIVGANAIYDRNGWANLRDALEFIKSDFELVVYSQTEITGIADPRVKYHIFNIENQADLYTDFDALILPRRYGGLCLPMNEALMSALPVIMSDISPNNKVLPEKWLLPAYLSDHFEGRSTIDVYNIEPELLASKIDEFCALPDFKLRNEKYKAFKIGYANYSEPILKPKYNELLTEIVNKPKMQI